MNTGTFKPMEPSDPSTELGHNHSRELPSQRELFPLGLPLITGQLMVKEVKPLAVIHPVLAYD